MTGLKRGTICLCEHVKEWETVAAEKIVKLKEIFDDKTVDIQHIGSTAIRSIKAKPIIDIAVAVDNYDVVIPLIKKLDQAGFRLSHHEVNGDMLFVCGNFDKDTRTHHIHIVKSGSMEWINYINFRDYLNSFPERAKEYEKLKINLMGQYPFDREAYTNGKADFINYTLRKALVWSYLGKTVKVKIDRPIGSVHPKHPDLIYPINYGYIEGVIGGDGEELDVYVLGVDKPLQEFTGKIIGIIHRENDAEDKLVAAPENMKFNQQQIAKAVHFQEQYYITTIDSLYRKSCGAIVFRKNSNIIKYLLLFQNKSQTWSFPKGHAEINETEHQTALREVFEETGLTVKLLPNFRQEIIYKINDICQKTVTFFLAECNQEILLREDEIVEYKWVNATEAKELLYSEYEEIIDRVEEFLK